MILGIERFEQKCGFVVALLLSLFGATIWFSTINWQKKNSTKWNEIEFIYRYFCSSVLLLIIVININIRPLLSSLLLSLVGHLYFEWITLFYCYTHTHPIEGEKIMKMGTCKCFLSSELYFFFLIRCLFVSIHLKSSCNNNTHTTCLDNHR